MHLVAAVAGAFGVGVFWQRVAEVLADSNATMEEAFFALGGLVASLGPIACFFMACRLWNVETTIFLTGTASIRMIAGGWVGFAALLVLSRGILSLTPAGRGANGLGDQVTDSMAAIEDFVAMHLVDAAAVLGVGALLLLVGPGFSEYRVAIAAKPKPPTT